MSRLVAMGNHFGAHKPFADMFDSVVIIGYKEAVEFEFKKGDVLLLGGGEDISPSLYNQKPSRHTGARIHLSERDSWERHIFQLAQIAKIPTLGICRGAQLICALSGGSLYQHVNNHVGSNHKMETKEGTVLNVCSVHHQMMNPFKTKHEMIGWAEEILSPVHIIENEKNVSVEVEPEIVFFEETKALAIQFHPEFMSYKDEAVQYSRQLVKTYLMEN